MVAFSVESNIKETSKRLNSIISDVRKGTKAALLEMRDVTVAEVVNNENWSNDAIYKKGPQKGTKYDLDDSGRLLAIISNKSLNKYVKIGKSGGSVGIGSIRDLDNLISNRSGSKNPNFSYWKVVVYGRSPIHGYAFVQRGTSPKGKVTGYAVPVENASIAPSEATNMFENGLNQAARKFPSILIENLKDASKGGGAS